MEHRWPTWIGVVVDDLEKQRRFYRDALGFRETGSSERWVHMEFPNGGLFELIQRDPSPQYEAKRYQVGFTVEDLQATREELIRRGVEPISEIEGQESGSSNLWCYFRDAEDNVFEITQWLQALDQSPRRVPIGTGRRGRSGTRTTSPSSTRTFRRSSRLRR